MVTKRTPPPMTAALLPLLLASLALAGCFDGPQATPPTAGEEDARPASIHEPIPENGTAVALPMGANLTACMQFHTFYPAPAGPLQSAVPDGFVMVTDDTGQLVNVVVMVVSCVAPETAEYAAWPTVSQMSTMLPVVPPPEAANETFSGEMLVMTLHTDAQPLFETYGRWGLSAAVGLTGFEHERHLQAGAIVEHTVFTNELESLSVASNVAVLNDAFDQSIARWWLTDGNAQIHGSLRVTSGAGTQVGLGEATWFYSGPRAAPEQAAGVSHRVDDGYVSLEWLEP